MFSDKLFIESNFVLFDRGQVGNNKLQIVFHCVVNLLSQFLSLNNICWYLILIVWRNNHLQFNNVTEIGKGRKHMLPVIP